MKVTPVSADCSVITEVSGLDPIHIFFIDAHPGAGYVTLICFGAAWTAYFGAMSGRTIRQFVAAADADYLATKMGIGPHLKETKRDMAYLRKIIVAVQNALVIGAVENALKEPE